MSPLVIQATEHTPSIVLDKDMGIFEISFRSLPENAIEFYKSVIDWLNEYAAMPNKETIFSFSLEYYNTASSKQIAKILLILEKIQLQNNSQVKIIWHYSEDDLDMLQSGKRYEKLLNIPFEFIAKNS